MKTGKYIAIIVLALLIHHSQAQRVSVSGTKFLVNGKEIVMNGANTPWNKWNDFGGDYTSSWWDAEFNKIKNAGGNFWSVELFIRVQIAKVMSCPQLKTKFTFMMKTFILRLYQQRSRKKAEGQ